MTISQTTCARYDRVIARAIKAGRVAAAKAARAAARGEKVTVVDYATKKKYQVAGYPYGWSNVHLVSGRNGLAQYLKSKRALGYNNSVTYYELERQSGQPREVFSPASLTQSLAVNRARSEAWAAVLAKAGIECYITERYD